MKSKFEPKLINAGFILAFLIILSISIVSYYLFKKGVEHERVVKNSYQVLLTSKEFLFNLNDAESGARGYIITGNKIFLESYAVSIDRNEDLLNTLKNLTSDNPDHQKRYHLVESLVKKKYSFIEEVLNSRRAKGLDASLASINFLYGKKLMDEINNIFLRINRDEQSLLLKRQNELKSYRNIKEPLQFYGIFASGTIVLFIFLVLQRQIRFRIKSEQELFIKNEWFSQTLVSIGDGVITTDTKGIITLINNAACEISKWQKEEAIGRHIEEVFEIIHEVSGQKAVNPALAALQQNKIVFLVNQTILKAKDGTLIYIDDSGAPINNKAGKIRGAVLIFRDITEKKKAEEEKTRYQSFLEAILENIPAMIFIKDSAELKFQKVNKAGEEMMGFSRNELLGKNDHDFFVKEEADFFNNKDLEVLKKGTMLDIPEEVISTKNGQRWLHTRKIPIFNEKGEAAFLLGISEDITERRMLIAEVKSKNMWLEQKVRERTAEIISQKKFTENILNNIPNDIAVFDSKHNYLFVNPGAIGDEKMRNWLIGKDDFEYCKFKGIDDSKAYKRRALFEKAISSKTNTEWLEEQTNKQGEKRYILRKFHPNFENERLINVIGYGIDITDLKKAEQAKKDYILALEEMMFMTSHKVRQPVSQIMGISALLESGIESQEELKTITGYMKESVLNLDSFTRELTTFINDLKQKSDNNSFEGE